MIPRSRKGSEPARAKGLTRENQIQQDRSAVDCGKRFESSSCSRFRDSSGSSAQRGIGVREASTSEKKPIVHFFPPISTSDVPSVLLYTSEPFAQETWAGLQRVARLILLMMKSKPNALQMDCQTGHVSFDIVETSLIVVLPSNHDCTIRRQIGVLFRPGCDLTVVKWRELCYSTRIVQRSGANVFLNRGRSLGETQSGSDRFMTVCAGRCIFDRSDSIRCPITTVGAMAVALVVVLVVAIVIYRTPGPSTISIDNSEDLFDQIRVFFPKVPIQLATLTKEGVFPVEQ